MYKRSIKLMFITQTNDFGISMLKHFDVIKKLVPSKDHFNNKKHYKCKNAILKQKNHHFLNFPKPMCQKLVAMAT